MALTPCGYGYQFYVNNHRELSCKLFQRSSDIALAGGWNIASASLLTILLAHVSGLKPKELIWNIGDAHIYANQVDSVRDQIKRTPRPFPKVYIDYEGNDLNAITYKHLRLEGYTPHGKLSVCMNA
jgi:thymidylate synthase